jgi:zinc protease
LELLRQVLREPSLPEEEFAVLKRERLANLEQLKSEPSALGPLALSRAFAPYAEDDVRYVPTIEEEIARVEAVSIEQVRTLYSDYLGSGAGELAIVGDFDVEVCSELLRNTLADWTAQQPYARIERPLTEPVPGGIQTIETPDKANATYLAGLLFALSDEHPDYPALVMSNFILGGGSLSSRLGDRIRQQDGLSYGVSSSFSASALDQRASLVIQAICNPENMERLQAAAAEETQRLWRDGVTAEELERAKSGYLEQLKISRANDSALAGMLNNLSYEGRTMAYYTALEKAIAALTPEQVSAAFRQHIQADNLVIVRAGDLAN